MRINVSYGRHMEISLCGGDDTIEIRPCDGFAEDLFSIRLNDREIMTYEVRP